MRASENEIRRRQTAEAAGFGTISSMSILAGTFAAFGVLLVAFGVATAVAGALDVDFAGFSDAEWRDIGIGGGVVLAVLALVAFLFGGYTAGRMGTRRGLSHGLGVLVLSLVVIGGAAAITNALADPDQIGDQLRDEGVPTAADTWTDIGIGVGVAVLVTMSAGALFGGLAGQRWHDRVVRRPGAAGVAGSRPARSSDDITAAETTAVSTAAADASAERSTASDGESLEFDSLDTSGDGRADRLTEDGGVDLREEESRRG